MEGSDYLEQFLVGAAAVQLVSLHVRHEGGGQRLLRVVHPGCTGSLGRHVALRQRHGVRVHAVRVGGEQAGGLAPGQHRQVIKVHVG